MAHKVTIRGTTEKKKDIERLEREYYTLSKQHKKDPTKVPGLVLNAARVAPNLALTAKADKSIRWTGAKFYQRKNKIGPMLTSKLFPRFHSHSLPKMNSIQIYIEQTNTQTSLE